MGRVEVIGHRGSRATHPENTLAAFLHAIDCGADGIEMDVVVTRDDVLAVRHDLDIGGVPVRQLGYEQIRKAHPIPRLNEVLELKSRGKFLFDIESKSAPAPLLLDAVRNAGIEERTLVRSFDLGFLRAFRDLENHIPTAVLDDSGQDLIRLAAALGAQVISPAFPLITPASLAAAHAAGLRVSAWTPNTIADWERLIRMGVDAIITDDPAALLHWLSAGGLQRSH